MKVLYFANIAAEYRIPFFKEMEKRIDIKFVITKQSLNQRIYNFGINLEQLNRITFLSENIFKHYVELINILITEDYDLCVVPPLDSFTEMIDIFIITFISSLKRKKNVLFWEKWKPEEEYIPIRKKLKNELQRRAFKCVRKRIDLALVPSQKSKEYFEKYLKFPKVKIKKVINTSQILVSDFNLNIRQKYNIDDKTCVVLYFGRVISRKGLDILIKAISKIGQNNIQLIVCGDGDFLEYNKELAKRLKVNCIFTGKIKTEERKMYFKSADIFVLPSRIEDGVIEAWGLTVNEAMDLEVACITSDIVGCSDDLIKDNINGLVFENESVESLKEKILKIKNDSNFKSKIIKNAKATIDDIYNYSNMADSFIKAFKSIK